MRLVIVESPTKAKTIEKFLGKGFVIRASYGHIRDLPNNAAEIPADIKKEKWARVGVNVDKNFEPLYIIPESKKKNVAELKRLLKDADEVLLATDEDREGEAISWHLAAVLNPKVPIKRMVFHEITKQAIEESLKSPRDIDENLVKAQETRRVIDRLFGYTVSPILWKKMAPRLSAGRVQSVALRLLVERERERISFRAATYWDLKAVFEKKAGSEAFEAELTQLGDKRIAIGKDFDPNTGKLKTDSQVVLLDSAAAKKLESDLKTETPRVASIEEKPYTTKPSAPFTTSTLQQEASRKLGYSAQRTMAVAQMLYENGIITYMRTDSTTLSAEALNAARSHIEREYGKEYLYPEPRVYKTKVRNAQEAHEAIRPAGVEFTALETVRDKFGMEGFRLYELIWKRTVASQMSDSRGVRVSVQIKVGEANFRAAGSTIEFAGYLRAYVEGSDDPEAELADREKILPKLTQGDELKANSLEAVEHVTQPPARFTEGSLIKQLEALGIGRPSTWATIVGVVLSRDYAFKKGTALVPTFLASAVIGLMEKYFTDMVDYEYTSRLEDDLDSVSRGEEDSLKYLKKFYFGNGHPGLKNLVEEGEKTIDPRIVCGIPIGTDTQGRAVEVRIGRFGPFLTNGENRASVPETLAPDELNIEKAEDILIQAAKGPTVLGADPATSLPVYLKKGRFGPYLQLGDMEEGKDKPKMASLLPGMNPDEVTFETALKLLEYPKSLGTHPETGEEVMAANGRYGPYIKSGTETRSIPTDTMSLLDVTLEKAIEILKEPKRRGRATSTPKNLREVGKHPATEAMITIRSGRYGLYVTDGKINASLPRGMTPEELKIDEAVGLLEARAAKIAENGGMPTRKGGRGGRGGAKATKAPKAAAAPKAKKARAKAPKAQSEPAAVVEAKPKAVVKRKAKKAQDGAVV